MIQPALAHSNLLIQENALKVLGLYCLLDAEQCEGFWGTFLQACKREQVTVEIYSLIPQESLKLVAVRAIFDMLLVHSIETSSVIEMDTVLEILQELLSDSNTLLRTTAVEGFAKLLFNNRITSNVAMVGH